MDRSRRRQQKRLVAAVAARIKYPLGSDKGEGGRHETFLTMRTRYYIEPRAGRDKQVDLVRRLGEYERLVQMREAQKKPHVRTGWLDKPGRPGTTGPGGCAWASVGPTNINGRVTNIAIDPTNNQRIFVTTVGGIWRSQDGGRRWQRVSDDFLATVFASVAVNPGNPTEILAGGGDPNYASAGSASGLGIWRSTSGGDPGSWAKVSPPALDNQIIFRIRFDPTAPNHVYAATSAGLYVGKHAGGSITWAQLGGFDADTNDVVVDSSVTPRLVYAGVRGGSATYAKGIWKHDGTSWHQRDTGIPTGSGRTIALALAASNPSTLYTKLENGSNGRLLGVYKTTTGGEIPPGGGNAWAPLPTASVMDDSMFPDGSGYSWYNSVLEVDPTNPNVVYGGGLNIFSTPDGGTTWNNVSGGADPSYPSSVHSDHHAVAFDPTNSKIVFVGDDGGIFQSTDTSAAVWHWKDVSHGMVITEFYRITSQQATATAIAGGSQDNGSELTFGNRTWYQFGGCDGADVAYDAQDSETVYANCNGGLSETVNPIPGTSGAGSSISPVFPSGIGWTPPIVTDRSLPGAALAAGASSTAGMIIKTTDAQNWSVASPNLPAGDSVAFLAIAPSSSFQTYYVGLGGTAPTVWRTPNGGTNWQTATTGLPTSSPVAGTVDWSNPSRAFASFAGNGVYITTDTGASWNPINGSGITALPSSVVTGIVVDPFDVNTLYVSTWIGVFKGAITPGSPPTASWTPFDEGLPDGMDINDIWVNTVTGVLTIGTMGHGAFQRDIRPGIACPAVMLVVRDNVFDRGVTPSPSGVPDAEHPVPDPSHPGFYKPNDDPAAEVYWWSSPDIRIDVPSQDPPQNQLASVDHVEFETAPTEIASPPPGVMKDSNPIKGQPAVAYIQVTNRGIQPASNVRVVAIWGDATSALPLLPNTFWSTTFPAGSSGCGPLDTSTGWQFVDPTNPCRVIPVVNPALPEVVGFNWNVPATAADHSCMMAIIESVDDPIDTSVRTSNEVRPWMLVPNHRQIGLRNLHLVTAASPHAPIGGLAVFKLPNHSQDLERFDLQISRAELGARADLAVLLPAGADFKTFGLKRVTRRLTDEQADKVTASRLQHASIWSVDAPHAEIHGLAVRRGSTERIGVLFRSSPAQKPGTASRFSVLVRQGGVILGGSTYILRSPGSSGPNLPKEE